VLEKIEENVWLAEGDTVSFLTFPYSTRMAIVRLAGGELWVWSPTRLDDALAAAVRELGPVRHLVAPNKIHHLFLSEWSHAWPEARLYAAPGLASKRSDLDFAAELGDDPPAAWNDEIEQVVFRGSLFMDEVVFFHRASRTLFVTDLIQKFAPEAIPAYQRWLMRLDGLVGPTGSTPREWRLSFLKRGAARAALRKALDWDPERIVIAHGDWVRSDGRAALARSLAWLRP
jgi:hypothetical protein